MSEPFKLAEALATYPHIALLDAFDAAMAELRAEEDAYLLEVFGSLENVIAAAKVYEVVYEPLEFKGLSDSCSGEVTLSRKMWFRKREPLG